MIISRDMWYAIIGISMLFGIKSAVDFVHWCEGGSAARPAQVSYSAVGKQS